MINKTRKIDNVGRLKIPIQIMESLSIKKGDSLEYYIENNIIIIKKFHSS